MNQKVIGLNLQDNSIRLQVFLAHAGIASRRKSEEYILAGRVSVNGMIITTLGTKVVTTDTITFDGEKVALETEKRYVLLNKPKGYVSSASDEKDRPCAQDLLQEAYSERLYNIGRLDMYSSGALLFTNDGEFARIIGHPSSEIEKEYIVIASHPINDECITNFLKGVRIDSVFYRAHHIEKIKPDTLKIILLEGKNREIRRVLGHYGVRIKKLHRIRIGSLELGDLKIGEFRNLTNNEIKTILADANQHKL